MKGRETRVRDINSEMIAKYQIEGKEPCLLVVTVGLEIKKQMEESTKCVCQLDVEIKREGVIRGSSKTGRQREQCSSQQE